MDLESIQKPDHMTAEEWDAHLERLRGATFLAEIRPGQVALVAQGANRSPFYLARSEESPMSDLFKPAEKAAGIPEEIATEAANSLKTVIDTLLSVQRTVEDRKGGEGAADADPPLGSDIVEALAKSGEMLNAMVESYGKAAGGEEGEGGGDGEEEAKAKAVGDLLQQVEQDRLSLIKARIEQLMGDGKAADEIQAEISALHDQLWKLDAAALAGLPGKVEEMSAKMEAADGKIEAVEKSAGDRKDETAALADLVQGVMDRIDGTTPSNEDGN